MLAAYYQPIVYGSPTTPGFDYLIGKNWNVQEKVTTAFVRGSLDHELTSNVTLRGNVGVQLVNTDQESTATQKLQGVVVPFTDGKDYTDVLPAINLAFMLPSDQAVRVGIARELARARMDQLKASNEIGYDAATGLPGGSGGTPLLDPWRANAFDLSYEKYFGSGAYVSAAAFYKDLKTYIFNQTELNHDFSDLLDALPAGFFTNPNVVPPPTGKFTRPLNGNGGNLKGIELATSLTGDLIGDALERLRRDSQLSRTPRAASPSRIRRATTSSPATTSATSRCPACRKTCGARRCTTRTPASRRASAHALARSTSARSRTSRTTARSST